MAKSLYKVKKDALKKIKKKIARKKGYAASGGQGYINGGSGGGGYINKSAGQKLGGKDKQTERRLLKKAVKKHKSREEKISQEDKDFRDAVMRDYEERLDQWASSSSSGDEAPAQGLSRGGGKSYSNSSVNSDSAAQPKGTGLKRF